MTYAIFAEGIQIFMTAPFPGTGGLLMGCVDALPFFFCRDGRDSFKSRLRLLQW